LHRHSPLGAGGDDGFDFSYEELIELDSRNVTRGLNNDELEQLPTKIVAKPINMEVKEGEGSSGCNDGSCNGNGNKTKSSSCSSAATNSIRSVYIPG